MDVDEQIAEIATLEFEAFDEEAKQAMIAESSGPKFEQHCRHLSISLVFVAGVLAQKKSQLVDFVSLSEENSRSAMALFDDVECTTKWLSAAVEIMDSAKARLITALAASVEVQEAM